MKKQIWKFVLPQEDIITLEIPKDAEILCVQTQRGKPCIWALVNPDAEKEKRRIEIVGTGTDIISDQGKYIGTFQLDGGGYVFHVLEVTGLI